MAQSVEQDRKAILAVLEAQAAAWNKGDLIGFMKGYLQSDQLSFFSGNTKTHGWKATLERYQKKYQGEGKEMGKLAFEAYQAVVRGTRRGAELRRRLSRGGLWGSDPRP